jgi:SAM-dependent methyltransferase
MSPSKLPSSTACRWLLAPNRFPVSSAMAEFEAEETRIQAAYDRRAKAGRSYAWSDEGHLFIVQDIERHMLSALKREQLMPLASRSILEIGCGNGHWLREFIKWGANPANLVGIDLRDDRIALARRLTPNTVTYQKANAAHLDFADASFDIVLQATVFTSILDAGLRTQVAAEMLRVLRPGGVVVWYDFRVNNPRNTDVRSVKRAEIERLFPNCRIVLVKTTLLPPLARALAGHSWLACQLLNIIPWSCTHYLGTICKTGEKKERVGALACIGNRRSPTLDCSQL